MINSPAAYTQNQVDFHYIPQSMSGKSKLIIIITYRATQFSLVKVEHLIEVGNVSIKCRQGQFQLHHTVLASEELLSRSAFVVICNHIETTVKVAVVSKGKVG